jgi:hypothetical protein
MTMLRDKAVDYKDQSMPEEVRLIRKLLRTVCGQFETTAYQPCGFFFGVGFFFVFFCVFFLCCGEKKVSVWETGGGGHI